MLGGMQLPTPERPGFCQACYCERCGQGFYEKARNAMRFNDGRTLCNEKNCSGEVRLTPVMGWQSSWREGPCPGCRRAAARA